MRNNDGGASANRQRVEQVFDKGNLVLIGIVLRSLRVGRVHEADGRPLHLKLSWVLFQEVATQQITVSVSAKNHVRASYGKQVVAHLNSVQLPFLDFFSLLIVICE